MEILICGSAAGEGIPSAFCRCRVCRNARKSGGFDARTRTAYQIGEEVRIDFGPDFLAQEIRLGFDSEKSGICSLRMIMRITFTRRP